MNDKQARKLYDKVLRLSPIQEGDKVRTTSEWDNMNFEFIEGVVKRLKIVNSPAIPPFAVDIRTKNGIVRDINVGWLKKCKK